MLVLDERVHAQKLDETWFALYIPNPGSNKYVK